MWFSAMNSLHVLVSPPTKQSQQKLLYLCSCFSRCEQEAVQFRHLVPLTKSLIWRHHQEPQLLYLRKSRLQTLLRVLLDHQMQSQEQAKAKQAQEATTISKKISFKIMKTFSCSQYRRAILLQQVVVPALWRASTKVLIHFAWKNLTGQKKSSTLLVEVESTILRT